MLGVGSPGILSSWQIWWGSAAVAYIIVFFKISFHWGVGLPIPQRDAKSNSIGGIPNSSDQDTPPPGKYHPGVGNFSQLFVLAVFMHRNAVRISRDSAVSTCMRLHCLVQMDIGQRRRSKGGFTRVAAGILWLSWDEEHLATSISCPKYVKCRERAML